MKAVGRVKTMSPNYGSESKPGFAQEFNMCMSCITKLEDWMRGRDFVQRGQSTFDVRS